MKRRSFLKKSAALTLPTFLGGLNVAGMPSKFMSSMINDDSDRVLVLIDMNGGNDGLNTIIPLDGYDNLANARPNIIIPETSILEITDTIGLHPGMTGVRNMFDNGNLTILQGIGYPNPNRSHFRSADIWNTATPADEYKTTGWLGRYLDDSFPGYPMDYPNADCPDPFAVTLGNSVASNCEGADFNFSMAIVDTNDIGGLTTGIEVPLPHDCYGSQLGHVIETYKKSNVYGVRIVEAAESGSSNESLYPDTIQGEQLKTVAKLISGGLQSKIYVIKIGGFDTHGSQITTGDATSGIHAHLLKLMSDAIYAFQEDLKLLGLEKRVVGMTFSEFGRNIKENAGQGTDHGSAGPMMVFGNCINPGIIGTNAEIGANVDIEEGVALQYDFKWIFGSILMDWFEVEEEKVKMLLTEDFQHVPIISECLIDNTNEIALIKDPSVYPNPCYNFFTLKFEIFQHQKVQIDISDVRGTVIKVIPYQELEANTHEIYVEMHNFSAGVYFVRIQAGNGVQTLRIIKH